MPATLLEPGASSPNDADTETVNKSVILSETPGGSYQNVILSEAQRSRMTCFSSDVTAQKSWAALPIAARLLILKKTRHLLASRTEALCDAIPSTLARNPADTRCSEIIPLLSACKFLEQQAASILKPRRLGRKGLPLWLAGIRAEVHRVSLGRILVIAPSNYPLFLPGVQVLQALAAGNSVLWKPGIGGSAIALLVAEALYQSGLPRDLLQVTDETIEAAQSAISHGVDKVVFTGSATSGRALLHQLADTLTPCVAELSGCDSAFVLPSADLAYVVKALAFGMRLNGSATCMAPRRIILVGADAARKQTVIAKLTSALEVIPGIQLPKTVQRQLHILLADATASGAQLHGNLDALQQPLLVTGATPEMKIAQADIFAPILTLLEATDPAEALAINESCPYALTSSIFGNETEARALAASVTAGTVLINDLMIPAADPRTPFGGRNQSGFGVTQGAEGLLEMTAPKTIVIRRGFNTRNYDATTALHEQLFDGVIQSTHAATFTQRLAGIRTVVSAASTMNRKNR